jgi:beta-glucosidase
LKKTKFTYILAIILAFITVSCATAVNIGMSGAVKKKTQELDRKVLDNKAAPAETGTTPPPTTNPPPTTTQTIDEKVAALLAKMTLDEKIGQMTLPDSGSLSGRESDVATYFIGAVLSGGNSDPINNGAVDNTPAAWANLYDLMQTYALQTRLAIPIIYGIDAVHGNSNIKGAVIFPHNIGLGCTTDETLVEQAGQVTAEEVTGTGTNWAYAPCIAVARDERWGRTYESFSEDPALVTKLGAAYIKGLQGSDLTKRPNVLGCAKHYVGDGGTSGGVDQGNTALAEADLRDIHMRGYVDAIAAGAKSIMVSYSSWNGTKMSVNKHLLTDVLKTDLGFKGFLVSDWDAISTNQLGGTPADNIKNAINAGLDMIMMSNNYATFITNLKYLVNNGDITQARIDDAVSRILKVKYEMGLFDSALSNRDYTLTVGSDAHRAIARKCVRESLVLLKNAGTPATLPLSKSVSKIFVAGKNADDLGNQCGGWTITWQGDSGNITTGTTILQGIKNAVSSGTTVTYDKTATGVSSAYNLGIVVVGETPYAEGSGDSADLALSDEDKAAIDAVKAANIPTVVILVSGRPLIIDTATLDKCDALVAAWLPGTEGGGVADVLFNDYNFSGKLSFSWPKSMGQIPINVGDSGIDPLFAYGFGLTY